jgi:hypothetical protein
MGTPRHTLGYTHAVTHQLTYPPLDEYRLLLSSRHQKIHQRWRYLRKVGMSGTRTSSLSLACTSWDLSAARVRLAPVIRRRHMTYDVRYFILHSLGAGPEPQVRPYRFCTEYKGIETNALPPCATVITYHQPVVLRTVRVCRVVFRRRFFSPYTPRQFRNARWCSSKRPQSFAIAIIMRYCHCSVIF